MAHELVVGLHVVEDDVYAQYRAAIAPLLGTHGGGFRYDFVVAETLKSASAHPINRVFAIYFESRARKEAFFAHPEYVAIKQRFFLRSVSGTTIFGEYER